MSSAQTANDDRLNILAFQHQDGLVDLFIGWVAFLGGLGFLTGLPYFAGIAPAIFLPVWQSFRRKVTYPRMGHLEHNSQNMTLFAFTILMGLVGLAGLLIFAWVLPSWLAVWLEKYILIVVGIIMAGIVGAIGAALRVSRLLYYSGLLVALFTAGYVFGLDLGWIMLTFGGLTIMAGVAVLIRFILTHPVKNR